MDSSLLIPGTDSSDYVTDIERALALCEPAAIEHPLPSGRVVALHAGAREELTIRGPGGRVELTVRFTERGPVLCFESADLELAAAGDVTVRARRFAVDAEESLALRSAGDIRTEAQGDQRAVVHGTARTDAGTVETHAHTGPVRTTAAGDQWINGRYILLNCDAASFVPPSDREPCCPECGERNAGTAQTEGVAGGERGGVGPGAVPTLAALGLDEEA